MHIEKSYLQLLQFVLENGEPRQDRTGVGTIAMFSPSEMVFDLRSGFPLLTTKKMFTRGMIHELLWFIKGDTNIKYLNENGVNFWNAWADDDGNLGPVYGKQWRKWENATPLDWFGAERKFGFDAAEELFKNADEAIYNTSYVNVRPGVRANVLCSDYAYYDGPIHLFGVVYDQIAMLIDGLKNNPHSRRHIVEAWNVGELDEMKLPACHKMFQCYVTNDGYLDLKLYQRSADLFLGVPVNIASYSLLLAMLAQVAGLKPRRFIHSMGDAHIYSSHINQVKLQLTREPKELPQLWLNPEIKNIDDFTFDDIKIIDYNPHPTIKGDIAV